MSITTMILGQSGTGKTTSLRHLPPEKTLLIQPIQKPLPFNSKGWEYCRKDESGNPVGNILFAKNSNLIVPALHATKRDIIVIDDFQYIMAKRFMNDVGIKGYDKYNELAKEVYDILMAAMDLPMYKRVYILSHTEETATGNTKMKTIGKLLDEKITLEGLVTIVLQTKVFNGNYLFSTQNDGHNTVKSPIGLFDDLLNGSGEDTIENDLNEVDLAICKFYGIERG